MTVPQYRHSVQGYKRPEIQVSDALIEIDHTYSKMHLISLAQESVQQAIALKQGLIPLQQKSRIACLEHLHGSRLYAICLTCSNLHGSAEQG